MIDKKQKDKIENVKQSLFKKNSKVIGRTIPHRGHKIFEYNRDTNEIILATIEDVPKSISFGLKTNNINYFAKNKPAEAKGKVKIKENCIYIPALNKKNVIKILKRDFQITI